MDDWVFFLQTNNINYLILDQSPVWSPIHNYINDHGSWENIIYHTDKQTQQLIAKSLNNYINQL